MSRRATSPASSSGYRSSRSRLDESSFMDREPDPFHPRGSRRSRLDSPPMISDYSALPAYITRGSTASGSHGSLVRDQAPARSRHGSSSRHDWERRDEPGLSAYSFCDRATTREDRMSIESRSRNASDRNSRAHRESDSSRDLIRGESLRLESMLRESRERAMERDRGRDYDRPLEPMSDEDMPSRAASRLYTSSRQGRAAEELMMMHGAIPPRRSDAQFDRELHRSDRDLPVRSSRSRYAQDVRRSPHDALAPFRDSVRRSSSSRHSGSRAAYAQPRSSRLSPVRESSRVRGRDDGLISPRTLAEWARIDRQFDEQDERSERVIREHDEWIRKLDEWKESVKTLDYLNTGEDKEEWLELMAWVDLNLVPKRTQNTREAY